MTDTTETVDYQNLLRQLEQTPLDTQGAKVLHDTVRQLRWVQGMRASTGSLNLRHPIRYLDCLPNTARVACPGVAGAYTHSACLKLFERPELSFYEEFSDVAEAVLSGKVDFGVLPVENSSAGQVSEVINLVCSQNLYICRTTEIKAEHCLCIHPDSDPENITVAVSHPQALAQCSQYLKRRGLHPERYSNTSTAARKIALKPGNEACVCSENSARLENLRILARNIQDYDQNYTRFICISPQNILLPDADTISIALSLPHEAGYLNKILTRFAACNLDLCRLLSMPIASREFSVLFFLDFQGNVDDAQVEHLLDALHSELSFFKFIGNHSRRE